MKTLFIRYAVHIQIIPTKAPETKKTHVEAKFNSFCLFSAPESIELSETGGEPAGHYTRGVSPSLLPCDEKIDGLWGDGRARGVGRWVREGQEESRRESFFGLLAYKHFRIVKRLQFICEGHVVETKPVPLSISQSKHVHGGNDGIVFKH